MSNFARVTVFALVLLSCAMNSIESADAQLRALNRANQRVRNYTKPTVFTGATRQLLRPLRLAESAIKKQDFERACLLIGEMLDDEGLKDCLVPDDKQWGRAVSLRQKAINLLGTLDESQRSAYREKYATRSAQLLEKAIDARDYQGIEFVSQRYLYTDAGLEATVLLGHHWLNTGRPQMSANAFGKLLGIARAEQLYPELTLLSAIASVLAKQEDAAVSYLRRLKEMQIDSVTFFDKQIPIFSDDQPPLEWLISLIGDSPLKSNAIVNQWLMWQGNPQRNAETGPGFPLFSPRWSTETLGEFEAATSFKKRIDLLVKNQIAPLPKTNLLTVGDTVVIRTAGGMIAIDARTGKRRWRFPAAVVELDGSYSNTKILPRPVPQSIAAVPKDKSKSSRQSKYYERVLEDTVFSQIASDGKLVFCIPDPGVATTASDWQKYRTDRFESPTDLRKYNEMCGIDVSGEGALVWQVGGVSGGDEKKLARTFFLGSPLPLDESLYCICVQEQLVKLVVLNSANGSLQWEKELASTEDNVAFTDDVVRRLAGATPSAGSGIVVCPTGLNAIVAVDVGTRSLKWGFQLSAPKLINGYRSRSRSTKPWRSYENRWRDTSLKISDGAVIYTPVDSKELCCIDIRTGRSRWNTSGNQPKTFKRSDAMYVASVGNGEIILVASAELRGVSLADGELGWKIPFDSFGIASGHGYRHGDSFYLPTTSKKLLRFDLAAGEKSIDKIVDTQRVLGNLYPWNTDIISVGLDHIAAFPCDEKSQQIFKIADTTPTAHNPVDWQPHARLAIEAQLKLQQGDFSDAARLISEAYDLFPNSSYAGVLVEALTELIVLDFERAETIFQRYNKLFGERDLQRLLQGKVDGLVRSQRYQEAFATLLEMAEGVAFPKQEAIEPGAAVEASELVQLSAADIDLSPTMSTKKENGVVEISRTAWLRWQISKLAGRWAHEQKMTVEMTKEDRLIAKHLEPFEDEDAKVFFQRLRLFPPYLIQPELRVETAERLLDERYLIQAKSLLMDNWTDHGVEPKVVAERLELLSQIAIEQHDSKTAETLLDRMEADSDSPEKVVQRLRQQSASLEKTFAEDLYDDQLYLKLAKDKSAIRGPRYDLDGVKWKDELGEISDSQYSEVGEGRHHCVILETDMPQIHKLAFRYEASLGEFQIHDSLGRLVRSVYLRPNGESDSFASGTTGKLFLKNSVMLFCIGKDIFALDWTQMVRGKPPIMWSVRLNKGTSMRNVFGSPSSNGVCFLDGSELKCVDLFTGQTQWVRNRIPTPATIKERGDRVTIWKDNRQIYETFDKLSGRRITGGKISKLVGSTSTGHNQFHLFQIPIRGKSPKPSSEKQSETPDDPFAVRPYTNQKLQMFDFEIGAIAWERTFPFPTVFRQVDQDSIAVLTRDGIFSMLDIATGKPRFERAISGLKNISVLQLSVTPMAQGYFCTVSTSESAVAKIEQDETTEVKFSSIRSRGWVGTGYVFSLDRQTGESLWPNPVRVESFGLPDGTPYNSPFVMLIRRASYGPVKSGSRQLTGTKSRIQIAMLDASTGDLKHHYLLKSGVVNDPRVQMVCRPGTKYQSGYNSTDENEASGEEAGNDQRIELTIARKRYIIRLTDAEKIDQPIGPTGLTNRNSGMQLETDQEKNNADEAVIPVSDLQPLAEQAKRLNEEMLERGKLEADFFEKERQMRQQQR